MSTDDFSNSSLSFWHAGETPEYNETEFCLFSGIHFSLRSMAVLSSRAQELQSPRRFSALARLYYLVRPTKTAMLRRLDPFTQ